MEIKMAFSLKSFSDLDIHFNWKEFKIFFQWYKLVCWTSRTVLDIAMDTTVSLNSNCLLTCQSDEQHGCNNCDPLPREKIRKNLHLLEDWESSNRLVGIEGPILFCYKFQSQGFLFQQAAWHFKIYKNGHFMHECVSQNY